MDQVDPPEWDLTKSEEMGGGFAENVTKDN